MMPNTQRPTNEVTSPIRRALLSVFDKRSILDLARVLTQQGAEILASGGTARALQDAGLPVTAVETYTGAPEILEGRVKTLHPKIAAGLLADRRQDAHLAQLAAQGYPPIDLVVCNLYPFAQTVAAGKSAAEISEMIDIGGDSGDWEKDRRQISRTELIGIMRPRVEEILEEVRATLDAAGFDTLPSQQIVLTGGASQIPGLDGIATRVLGQRVRLGRPLRVQGLPQAATGAAFASAVGLCLFAAHPQDEWWDFEIPAERYPARSLRRAVKWFKDNWGPQDQGAKGEIPLKSGV